MAELDGDDWLGTPEEHEYMHRVMAWRSDPRFIVWTIYDHPAEHPNYIVLRPWEVVGSNHVEPGPQWLCPDIDSARNLLRPLELTCIPRSDTDPPAIVESWI